MEGAESVLYVSRFPPSPSGVALYARDMLRVLETWAVVDVLDLPPDPRASQSWPLAARLAHRARMWVRKNPGGVVMFELAGRGQAEFWCAWWLTRRRDARIWVTVHDVPAISGGAFFTRAFDRRGLRRLARMLSDSVGRSAERSLLGRSSAVFALSDAGAASLTQIYRMRRPALALPHVMPNGPIGASKTREMLVPGYVVSARDVVPVLEALAAVGPGWRLTVGACPDAVESELRAFARAAGLLSQVSFTGFLAEPELVRCFERAAIVVRWRDEGWAGSAGLAVSGPTIRAMGNGCAVVTNDSRGTRECLEEAGAVIVPDGTAGAVELKRALVELTTDPARCAEMGRRARSHLDREHSPSALTQVLRRAAAQTTRERPKTRRKGLLP